MAFFFWFVSSTFFFFPVPEMNALLKAVQDLCVRFQNYVNFVFLGKKNFSNRTMKKTRIGCAG
jgi:hypothetical protein